MGYRCKAPADCACTLWDYGNICGACDGCIDLVRTLDIRQCKCLTIEPPEVFGEGTARQYVKNFDEFEAITWNEFDGYVVMCPECGAVTKQFKSVEKAINAWNTNDLYYEGYVDES